MFYKKISRPPGCGDGPDTLLLRRHPRQPAPRPHGGALRRRSKAPAGRGRYSQLFPPFHCSKTNGCPLFHDSQVRLGEHDLSSDDDGASPIDVGVAGRVVHSRYNPRNFDNDIALVVLDREVEFTEKIAPACLPVLHYDAPSKSSSSSSVDGDDEKEESFVGYTPFVAGWGTINFGGPTSDTLLEIQLQVLSVGCFFAANCHVVSGISR